MTLQTLDWTLCGVSLAMFALGVARGFSGVLAFVAASVASAAFGVWFWPLTVEISASPYVRGGVSLAAAVVVFGLVRISVKKIVNGLLAQPVDTLAGAVVGLACAALLFFAASRLPPARERSTIAAEVARHV